MGDRADTKLDPGVPQLWSRLGRDWKREGAYMTPHQYLNEFSTSGGAIGALVGAASTPHVGFRGGPGGLRRGPGGLAALVGVNLAGALAGTALGGVAGHQVYKRVNAEEMARQHGILQVAQNTTSPEVSKLLSVNHALRNSLIGAGLLAGGLGIGLGIHQWRKARKAKAEQEKSLAISP